MAEVSPPASAWRLRGGQYLGEVSALCFLHLPRHSTASSLPLLLSGSGSQMFVHSIESGKLIRSFHVFEGIRVHGITSCSVLSAEGLSGSAFAYTVAVYGERRAKLFNLSARIKSNARDEVISSVELRLLQTLPKLNHWVLDVCFLKGKASSSVNGGVIVAVGCSDNSISLWDVSNSSMILRVQSPERSLLYSMRLWGDNLEDLRIASGTIYNEIIVWRVVPHPDALSLTSSGGESASRYGQHEALHMCRLVGHEGSIFRIAWSSDGSKLVSVSDDRSARIWQVHFEANCSGSIDLIILFGHNARVWDCVISDNMIITASEDCSCRLWGLDGKQFMVIKEHIGRGIWRCLFDPTSSILITGGFDSGVKVHQFNSMLSRDPDQCSGVHEDLEKTSVFSVRIPNSSEGLGLMDSKSEYVRGLRFSSEDSVYVTTNRGYLYHAKLSRSSNVTWAKLVHVSPESPIVCMDLLSQSLSTISAGVEDWVAVGDGKGHATIVNVVYNGRSPTVGFTFSWSAEMDRQLLGIYWCRSLGHRLVFTADPRGVVKLWRLDMPVSSILDDGESSHASLLAEFVSHLGIRIMCLDASPQKEVLICGDLRGNLVIFPLLKDQLLDESGAIGAKIFPVNLFKGAHGISSVSSIAISGGGPNYIEIRSTGADGCICYLEYDRDLQIVKFVGMKQVKELSLVESVFGDNKSSDDLGSSNYAVGFASADFLLWNLATETKVLQVPCGGWRRPHSYYLGNIPEKKNCFAYVKDEIIHIHRLWKSGSGDTILPRNLHMQFHGRELHSLCFVRQNPQIEANERSSWIVTGCEDGTVRLTRYNPSLENWSSSRLLGEHVGGSAVRSICYVSKTHRVIKSYSGDIENAIGEASPEAGEDPVLLVSVGAKRVLTSWLLRNQQTREEKALSDQPLDERENGSAGSSEVSFQWLSTDMPVRNKVPPKKSENFERFVKGKENVSAKDEDEKAKLTVDVPLGDGNEDDWRYLAVTAFLVRNIGSGLTVCFTVVACSDATLTLRALVLPYCLWFDVGMLVPLSSPVLSLRHAIVPVAPRTGVETRMRNLYIVISGATDGSIAFWDLTGSVEAFMEQLSKLHLEKLIECQKRPRTGRGSQGGRWWRTLKSRFPKKPPGSDSENAKPQKEANGNMFDSASCNTSSLPETSSCLSMPSSQAMENDSTELERNSADNGAFEISEINPLHVISSIHQSGVNCMHVSEAKYGQCPKGGFLYHLVSGGDDQALHILTFEVLPQSLTPDPDDLIVKHDGSRDSSLDEKQMNNCMIKFICVDKVESGHSSAVKGVWTDGAWVFSTGLDQRVRCWFVGETGKLSEHGHLIISVPEPEALDARARSWDRYQIAVAGRGMQMIEFCAEKCRK